MSAIVSKLESALADINDIADSLNNKIQRLDSLTADQRNSLDREIDQQLNEYEELLNSMNRDVNNVKQPDSRKYFEGEITEKRKQLSNLTTSVKQKRLIATNNPATRQQQQLASNASRSQEIVENLKQTTQLAHSTIEKGNKGIQELELQRTLLEHTDKNVYDIYRYGQQGEKTANSMLRRNCINGCISWTIDALLFAAFIASLIYKLVK